MVVGKWPERMEIVGSILLTQPQALAPSLILPGVPAGEAASSPQLGPGVLDIQGVSRAPSWVGTMPDMAVCAGCHLQLTCLPFVHRAEPHSIALLDL